MNAGSIALFDNDLVPAHNLTPADFNEASFVGYSRASVPGFGTPFLNGDGKAETDSAVQTWTFTAGAGTAVVYGWYLLSSGDAIVLAFSKFTPAVVLTPAANILTRVIQLTGVGEL